MQFNINFIAIEGRLINLQAVDVVENLTEEGGETTVQILFAGGNELALTGDEADQFLDRVELITEATDVAINTLKNMAQQTGVNR